MKKEKKKIDINKIAETLTNMATKMIKNEPLKKIRYRVSVEISEEIALVLEQISEQLGISCELVISKLAAEGLDIKLHDLMKNGIGNLQKPKVENQGCTANIDPVQLMQMASIQKENTGIDFTKIVNGMGQLNNLVVDLEKLQRIVQNVTPVPKPEPPPNRIIKEGKQPKKSDYSAENNKNNK